MRWFCSGAAKNAPLVDTGPIRRKNILRYRSEWVPGGQFQSVLKYSSYLVVMRRRVTLAVMFTTGDLRSRMEIPMWFIGPAA